MTTPQFRNAEEFFVQMAEWLALEAAAEIVRMAERRKRIGSEKAERSGESILDLVILDHGRGLGGRWLVSFGRRNRQQSMPWHRLSVGSPVVVSNFDRDDGSALTGVVSARRPDSLQVALDRWPDWQVFRIDLTADEVTRQRMLAALQAVRQARGRLGQLRDTLTGQRPPEFVAEPQITFRAHLNPSQQAAVRFALSARDVAVIHGPPGTGKTTTLVELMVQAVADGARVLACAPTNTAVDNLLERLVAAGQKVVRLGHPARVSQALQDHTLDGLVERSDEMAVIQSMRREAEEMFRLANRHTRARPARGQKADMRREARQLLGHARQLEKRTVEHFLDRADVICATNTLNESIIGDRHFDLLVIDEAAQSIEPGCWIPLVRCDRVILAGDHFQLPPTILSRQAAVDGLEISLMQRLTELYGPRITRMLDVQYRMHDHIMQFSSERFYEGKLHGDASVRTHRLCDLAGIEENELTRSAVLLIDTAGAGWDEEQEREGLSRLNRREAGLILELAGQLVEAGLSPRDMAVIAPYAAQARWLREHNRFENLEIDTVDGFQGREKEAVLITLVRSNPQGEVGFLAETRRMNVALTRARRKLIVIGDSATVGRHDFYSDLVDYAGKIGAYKSVWEVVESV
jgi:superfamily I DNA and/or RNA helicase